VAAHPLLELGREALDPPVERDVVDRDPSVGEHIGFWFVGLPRPRRPRGKWLPQSGTVSGGGEAALLVLERVLTGVRAVGLERFCLYGLPAGTSYNKES
jgi:hypothetical protein